MRSASFVTISLVVLSACGGGTAQPSAGTTGPSASSAAPTADPSASEEPTSSSGAVETPESTAPTGTPTPIEPISNAVVGLPAELRAMTITDSLRVRSIPATTDDSVIYRPVLPRGARFRIVEGPVAGGGYWWYRVSGLAKELQAGVDDGWVASADVDGTPWIAAAPDACDDLGLTASSSTAADLAALNAGFPGTWGGCVSTPWVPPYWVTVEFRADGTYSAASQPIQRGDWQPAFYHGYDTDSPDKRYHLSDVLDDGTASGEIDITYDTGSVVRGSLVHIKLMGDRLDFEFFHGGVTGPIAFQLMRLAPSS